MNARKTDSQQRMWTAIYAVGALLVIIPVLDLATNVLPWRPSDVSWRYGAVGLLSGFLMTPLLGMLVLCVAAAARGDRGLLKVLGGINLATAGFLVLGLGLFLLDSLQIRGQVDPAGRMSFDIGAVKAAFKHGTGAVALLLFGLGSLRTARGIRPTDSKKDGLLVSSKQDG